MRSIITTALMGSLALGGVSLLATPGGATGSTGGSGPPVQAGEKSEGAKIFVEQDCNSCHTIDSKGIELTDDAEDDAEDAPDLSDVGAEYDREWIAKYLLKRVEKDGEEHEKRFRGGMEDLKTVASWLGELKDSSDDDSDDSDEGDEGDEDGDEE